MTEPRKGHARIATGTLGRLRYVLRHPVVRAGAWAAALCLVAAATSFAAWLPTHQRVQHLAQELGAKSRALREADQSEKVRLAYEQARKAVEVLEAKLEQAATQAQLLEDFGRLARQHGVRIVSEAYEEGKGAGVQQTLNAELAIRGSYGSIRGFLAATSALRTWSEIDEVVLERAREAGVVEGKVRIVTYRGTTRRLTAAGRSQAQALQ